MPPFLLSFSLFVSPSISRFPSLAVCIHVGVPVCMCLSLILIPHMDTHTYTQSVPLRSGCWLASEGSPGVLHAEKALCPCLMWASLAQLAGRQGANVSLAITRLERGSHLGTGMSWMGRSKEGTVCGEKKKKKKQARDYNPYKCAFCLVLEPSKSQKVRSRTWGGLCTDGAVMEPWDGATAPPGASRPGMCLLFA